MEAARRAKAGREGGGYGRLDGDGTHMQHGCPIENEIRRVESKWAYAINSGGNVFAAITNASTRPTIYAGRIVHANCSTKKDRAVSEIGKASTIIGFAHSSLGIACDPSSRLNVPCALAKSHNPAAQSNV